MQAYVGLCTVEMTGLSTTSPSMGRVRADTQQLLGAASCAFPLPMPNVTWVRDQIH